MPAPAYYTTYSANPMPEVLMTDEASAAEHIHHLLDRMTYTDLPGFVIRSAGRQPSSAFKHLQKSAQQASFAASEPTVYKGQLEQPIPGAPQSTIVRMPEHVPPTQNRSPLGSVYVSTGALMLELFQPGPEMETLAIQGIPSFLPDEEYYALSRGLINPAWLRSNGIVSTMLLPNDLGVYRSDRHITATRKLSLSSSAQRTVPLNIINASQSRAA